MTSARHRSGSRNSTKKQSQKKPCLRGTHILVWWRETTKKTNTVYGMLDFNAGDKNKAGMEDRETICGGLGVARNTLIIE